jgi:glucosamine-6-phosphate deaminase
MILADPAEVAAAAAQLVVEYMKKEPAPVLGLAAGATPVQMYARLVQAHGGGLDFSGATAFALDEYVGLSSAHPASCTAILRSAFLDRVNIAARNQHLLADIAPHLAQDRATAHEAAITSCGGIDIQFLGLGRNGHIGFNEPGADPAGRTRVVALSDSTRVVNRPGFAPDGETPPRAVTMGVGTILSARKVVLLATGSAKADIVQRMIEGPVSADVPASFLRNHPDWLVLVDQEAASRLTRT